MNERSFALSDHQHHMAFPAHHGFMFHSHEDNDHHPSPSSLNSLPSCPPQLFPGLSLSLSALNSLSILVIIYAYLIVEK
jgi:hypothetical protein